ncbi:MAG: NAD(P)H-binding protein, partial [Rhodospirillaceae bacterium]|nr:NAD(P)H-binding protein [Rhodospirillaceae bacterium]
MKVCIVGASGKLGQYMVQHALDRGYQVVGVCRAKSVDKLSHFKGRITIVAGATNDTRVIKQGVAECDGVLCVLVPWGVDNYAAGTAQAVLDHAPPDARLVFSCGWHITRDGLDVYSWPFIWLLKVVGWLGRLARIVDIDDQVEAARRVFESDSRWTIVRGSDLEEGKSQGLPAWSKHV